MNLRSDTSLIEMESATTEPLALMRGKNKKWNVETQRDKMLSWKTLKGKNHRSSQTPSNHYGKRKYTGDPKAMTSCSSSSDDEYNKDITLSLSLTLQELQPLHNNLPYMYLY